MNIEELISFHEISQLKYRYVRAVDTQDWPLLTSVFTKNVRTWYDSGKLALQGRENVVAALVENLASSVYSSHIALHPEITFTGPASAKGIWRIQDVVHFTASHPNAFVTDLKDGDRLMGAGYYHDEYEKEDGQWKIASTGFVRIFESVESIGGRPGVRVQTDKSRGKLNS
jgi:hypothetical protein